MSWNPHTKLSLHPSMKQNWSQDTHKRSLQTSHLRDGRWSKKNVYGSSQQSREIVTNNEGLWSGEIVYPISPSNPIYQAHSSSIRIKDKVLDQIHLDFVVPDEISVVLDCSPETETFEEKQGKTSPFHWVHKLLLILSPVRGERIIGDVDGDYGRPSWCSNRGLQH